MKIREVINHLEKKFPLSLQEDFDNCGIQCGDKEQEITGVLVCFDLFEEIIEEAISKKANLIISHHPLIVRTLLKRIEPTNRIGKIIFKAIENHLVIYSMHTNIDNANGGGNDLFAQKLGLMDVSVLSPKLSQYQKIVFYAPEDESSEVKDALFKIGCGVLGKYENCSYSTPGQGTFKPLKGAKPHIGDINYIEEVNEERVEMIFPAAIQRNVINTLYKYHPYEEPAFDIIRLENPSRDSGLGRVGKLPSPMEESDFFNYLKKALNINHIRFSGKLNRKIEKVALCGGGGASFIHEAMAFGADVYISGDFKYHDFFVPDNQMLIADIGHFEGEHFIKEIIYNEIKENFITFATSLSEIEKLKIQYI